MGMNWDDTLKIRLKHNTADLSTEVNGRRYVYGFDVYADYDKRLERESEIAIRFGTWRGYSYVEKIVKGVYRVHYPRERWREL